MSSASKDTASPSADTAGERIARYLSERGKMQKTADIIHGLHGGHERAAELTVPDLRQLLEQHADMYEALKMAQRKAVKWHPSDPILKAINAALRKATGHE